MDEEDFEKQEIKETMKEEELEEEKVISSTFSEVNSSMESRYKTKPSKNLVKKKIFQDEIQFSEESDESQESIFAPKESINSEDFTEDEEIFSSAPQNKDSSFDDDFGKFFTESKKRKHKEIPSKKKFQKTKIQSVIEREGLLLDFLISIIRTRN
jgi:hypothetical protein